MFIWIEDDCRQITNRSGVYRTMKFHSFFQLWCCYRFDIRFVLLNIKTYEICCLWMCAWISKCQYSFGKTDPRIASRKEKSTLWQTTTLEMLRSQSICDKKLIVFCCLMATYKVKIKLKNEWHRMFVMPIDFFWYSFNFQ